MARISNNIQESVKDFLLTEDNELVIENGDFVISYSDDQHIEAILQSDLGHFKQFPNLGAGLQKDIDSSGFFQEIEAKIRLNLESDGYQISKVKVEAVNSELTVKLDSKRTRFKR